MTLEVSLDENKVLDLRGYLDADPSISAAARLGVGEDPTPSTNVDEQK